MKELKPKEKVSTKIVAPVYKKLQQVSQLMPKPGQICWEMEMKTGEIKPAEIKTIATHQNAKIPKGYHKVQNSEVTRKQVIVKDAHVYCVAINKKNAARHFTKFLIQLKEQAVIKNRKL